MSRYASQTTVSPGASREEIERILERYGATAFMYGQEGRKALVQFDVPVESVGIRRVRFVLDLPDRNADEFRFTPARRNRRSENDAFASYQQAVRQRWRALCLVIKAKLEAVEAEITSFEREFLAFIVLPDGRTVGEHTEPAIAEAYRTGEMVPMLPAQATGPRLLASGGER